MAFRTHPVPILSRVSPVKPVGGIQGFVRIKMIPTLFPNIPSQRKTLEPPTREGQLKPEKKSFRKKSRRLRLRKRRSGKA